MCWFVPSEAATPACAVQGGGFGDSPDFPAARRTHGCNAPPRPPATARPPTFFHLRRGNHLSPCTGSRRPQATPCEAGPSPVARRHRAIVSDAAPAPVSLQWTTDHGPRTAVRRRIYSPPTAPARPPGCRPSAGRSRRATPPRRGLPGSRAPAPAPPGSRSSRSSRSSPGPRPGGTGSVGSAS